MLSGVHTEAREANADEIGHVRRDSLTDIVLLSVQICQARQPSVIELEWVRPGAERALTVEISRNVCSVRVLQAWDQSSVFSHLVRPVVGEVWGALAGVIGCALTAPVRAPVAASIAMIEDIITTT